MKESSLRLLGSAMRRLRKDRKLTQEDVAYEAGLNPNYYGRIERGGINVTIETLLSIASALTVNLKDLFVPELSPTDVKRLRKEINDLITRLDAHAVQVLRDLLLQISKRMPK